MWILRSRGFVLTVVLLLTALCGYRLAAVVNKQRTDTSAAIPGVLWPDGKALQPFSLTDHRGRPFGLAQLHGRWTLLNFGYTSCPDVCPMTMHVLRQTDARLAELGVPNHDLQVVFVSVDPERDTPTRLGAWVQSFGADYVGVTAGHDALQVLTRQLGVAYKHADQDAAGQYLVSHSASVLLIDPQARLVAVLSAPHSAEHIAEIVAQIRMDKHKKAATSGVQSVTMRLFSRSQA